MTITNYALIRHEFDFSAVYVAEDSTLHQSIRSFAVKESKLLYSIGIAPMEEEIQKSHRTHKQNQDSMVEEFGIVFPYRRGYETVFTGGNKWSTEI